MEEVNKNSFHRVLITLIVFVVILILVSAGYLFYVAKMNKSSIIDSVPEKPIEEQMLNSCLASCNSCKQNCQDNFFLESSQSKEDESLCDKIINEFVKSECTESFTLTKAIANLDLTLCSSLPEDKQSSCIYSVTFAKAVSSNDISLCDYLNNSATGCKDNFNFKNKLCEQIISVELKTECINSITLG